MALAAQHSETYMEILVEDCKEYDQALAYLQGISRKEASSALQKYGKVRSDLNHTLDVEALQNKQGGIISAASSLLEAASAQPR